MANMEEIMNGGNKPTDNTAAAGMSDNAAPDDEDQIFGSLYDAIEKRDRSGFVEAMKSCMAYCMGDTDDSAPQSSPAPAGRKGPDFTLILGSGDKHKAS